MNDDEVQAHAYAHASPVAPIVAIGEVIAVSYDALMFHSRIRDFNQFVTVFHKWVWSKVVRKCSEHAEHLGKLLLRLARS